MKNIKTAMLLLLILLTAACSNNEESARKLLNQAITLQQNNQQEEAGKIYDKIVKDYPDTQTAVDINKQRLVRSEIIRSRTKEILGVALDAYRMDNGSYPSTEEGLTVLVRNPSNLLTWKGPYLANGLPPTLKITYKKDGEDYTLAVD